MKSVIDVRAAHKALANKLLEDPDDPATLVTQMALLFDNGEPSNWPHVAWLARRAWRNAPNDIVAMFNYASALQRIGQYRQASEIFKQCVDKNDPAWQTLSLHHLGISYRSLGRNQEAIDCYERSIALAPDRLDYQHDRAMALLANEEFGRGLEAFEVRKKLAEEKLKRNNGELIAQHKTPRGPYWQGENLAGKSILVYHEDGTGDFIQFCRFIPMLRDRGAGLIYLAGPVPDVLDLVADNIRVDGIVPLDQPHPCDCIVGSMSVPWLCGARLEDVSGKPYFKAEPAEFRRRSPLEIGLVWHGNPAYPKDIFRSTTLSALCPLFDIPGIAFYSLQIGSAAEEIHKLGLAGFIGDLAPHSHHWRNCASLVRRLDAMITVDTAMGHLAGALGVPVFILIANDCDWRWNRNSERSRWYDSATVVRQSAHGNWAFCVGWVKEILEEWADERRQTGDRDRQSAAGERVA